MRWPFHNWIQVSVFGVPPRVPSGGIRKFSEQCGECGLLRHYVEKIGPAPALTYEPIGTNGRSHWHYPDGKRRCGKPREE